MNTTTVIRSVQQILGVTVDDLAGPVPTHIPWSASLAFCLATLSLSCDAASPRDASLEARMASCDSTTARSAVAEMLRDPKTLSEPLMLFHAASAERAAGRTEEAAFLYLAARLRTSRQVLFEKGDRPQLLAIMNMTVGPLIVPVLEADPELARRVVKRTIDWDRSTPDPFRDRQEAKSGEIAKKIAEIDAGLGRLPDQMKGNAGRVAKARAENERAERQIKTMHAQRCGPGTLDPVDAEAAVERIKAQAQLLAAAHPLVLSRSGGAPKFVNMSSFKAAAGRLPSRLTLWVTPASGKPFNAEVDVVATITPGRKLGSVRFSLACLTEQGIGQREAFGKDICLDDPKAIKATNAGGGDLSRFDIGADGKSRESPPVCGFPDLKLPADFSVFAAGAYSGRTLAYQIDQSGHQGTQIDVAVNHPDKPVVLMLGAYSPTIWNVGWSKETKILAVLVGGYHRQAIIGLDKSIPLLISTDDNKGACEHFYVSPDSLASLSPLSKRVFGRQIDIVYPAANGKVDIGKPMPAGAALIRFGGITPESFFDKNAPIAGPAGLEDAVRKGQLRKATAADAQAWADAMSQSSPKREAPSVAGQGTPKPQKPPIYNAYVVLKPLTYPAGLHGGNAAVFLIPKGVPKPAGDPGHSGVYDFNTMNCQGPWCRTR